MTHSTAGGEQLTSSSTPTPAHIGSSNPRRPSLPIAPVNVSAPHSAQRSARRNAFLGPRNHPTSDVGIHTREVITLHGYPSDVLAIVVSVQVEFAPEAWTRVLQRRINGGTREFIDALVNAMRRDLALS